MVIKIEFIGWQRCYGHTQDFPLFNLQTETMFCPTTVSDKTLVARGYEVPAHPTLEEWEKLNGDFGRGGK